MKSIGLTMFLAVLLQVFRADAEPLPAEPQAGDIYEITIKRDSSQQQNNGSSGSSLDRNMIMERVIEIRDDGLELEYDLPEETAARAIATTWQFPARVFRPHRGPMQLLNRSDLEARVETWLKATNLTRAACGRWIVTWNAFRIECDPQSVIGTLEVFDLRTPDPDKVR